MTVQLKDLVGSTLSSGVTAAATSWPLVDGSGFPDPANGQYWVRIWNETDFADASLDSDSEEVRVTARVTNTLTVVRGENPDVAANHNTGGKTYRVEMAGGKRAINSANEELNLLNFGENIGDGSTDATNAIQNAINALPTTGGVINCPKGTYKITGLISVTRDDVIFQGAGWNRTIFKGDSLTTAIFDSNSVLRKRIWFRDLQINNTARTAVGGIGLDWENTQDSGLFNVRFFECETALRLTGANCAHNVYYSMRAQTCGIVVNAIGTNGGQHQNFYGGKWGGNVAVVRMNGCTGFNFHGVQFAEIIVSSFGIEIQGVNVCTSTSIIGCDFDASGGNGTGVSVAANALDTNIIGGRFTGLATDVDIIAGAEDETFWLHKGLMKKLVRMGGAGEILRLVTDGATDDALVKFFQTTTEKARVGFEDVDDKLLLESIVGEVHIRSNGTLALEFTTAQQARFKAGIGLGNIVADTSAPPANVANKFEIFDENGVSKGFVPVYSAI